MKTRLFACLLIASVLPAAAPAQGPDNTPQSDVMIQGFYWNSNPGGIWWDSLARLAPRLGSAGFGAIWFPPPVKGQGGGFSMGYDPYDHYDFGEFNQQGSIETRFGSRQELINAIAAFHNTGMQVFADAVMGHMNGGEALVPVDCEPYPSYPDSAYLLFNYPNGSGRFRKNASFFYPNQITCDVNPPYHGPYDQVFKFGEVLAHTQPHVRDSLLVWGQYLRNVMKFDGFRIDAVKHIDPAFVGPWLQAAGGYAVAEYYGSASDIGGWLNQCQNVYGGDVSMFDFPLRFTLQDMCNNTGGTFDMTWLDGAGLVNAGISGLDVSTFVENHDLDRTGWDGSVDNGHNPILSDKDMAYGYILFSEGRPCVFFRDYFIYGLASTIDRLIWIREKFLWGGTTRRSGLNPWYVGSTAPQADQAKDIYVARRDGGNGRPQAFLVMNDNPTEWRGVWVNSSHPNQVFRDYTGVAMDKQAAGDGRVELWAPPRGIAVYVPDTTQHVNHHPYITLIPDRSAFVNTPFSSQVDAGDLDGDTLAFQMSGNPAWLSLSASGLLSGTPSFADTAAVSQVIVTVTDPWGGGTADTFSMSVRSRPLIDGAFEGEGVWGPPVAVADTVAGWDGVRARKLYITQDDNYYYVGATIRSRQWMNWAFLINARSGGGGSESWSRNITYQHAGRPDFILRGHFQGYAEFHTWNGGGWSGVGAPLAPTEFAENIALDSLQDGWVEGRILKSAIGAPPGFAIQCFLTGNANGNATFDACPDDQNTTAWTGSPTALHAYAFYGAHGLSEVNLQFPASATIPGGGSATVYARTFGAGVTDTAGAGPGVAAWIGVSAVNTNPAGWTTWVPAVYNADYSGADEFHAAIGSDLAGGTYYYASRFQYPGGPYLTGGYSASGGGEWNGTTNVSGVLTVQAAPATPVPASPLSGSRHVSPDLWLTWNASPGLNAYHLQLSLDSAFTAIVLDDSTISGTSRHISGLAYGTTHHWRVLAKNAFGSSSFSVPWSFTVFTPETTTVAFSPNWNVVSVPLTVLDGRRSFLFPGAISEAFTFNPIGGYTARDTMTPGAGYWLKFPAGGTVPVSGGVRPADTLHLAEGWNLIGSISVPVDVSTIAQIPDSIVRSLYYGYDGGYTPADSIHPGRAYWVKSASAGKLVLSDSGAAAPPAAPPSAVLARFGSVTMEDALGRRQILFAGVSHAGGAERFAMPPGPPPGIFDARFASGRIAELVDPAGEKSVPLAISSAVYPLTLTWSAGEAGLEAELLIDGRRVRFTDHEAVTLTVQPAALAMHLHAAADVPAAFALGRNYPNPFNPETRVGFAVPVAGHVTLRVYNLLGQEIAVLEDGVTEAGYHTAVWNGRTRSGTLAGSGVYLVRMETAGGFVAVQKMMLLR
jgi:alpha-amylase